MFSISFTNSLLLLQIQSDNRFIGLLDGLLLLHACAESEAAQNLSKKHPAHSLIKTSRVDGVKKDADHEPSRCCCWFFVICSSKSSVNF